MRSDKRFPDCKTCRHQNAGKSHPECRRCIDVQFASLKELDDDWIRVKKLNKELKI